MDLGIAVTGDRNVSLKFDEFPEQLRGSLTKHITRVIDKLDAAIRAEVPVKSGQLLAEVQIFVDQYPDAVVGKVKIIGRPGTQDFAKAMALEYGAHAAVAVKAYSRQVDSVFGKLVSPFQQMVDAYSRVANIQEHDFLRGPLEAVQSEAIDEMKAAIDEATEE